MSFRKLLSFHGRRKDVDFIFNQTRTATHTYRDTYAKGRRITHSERQQTNSLHTHVTRDLRGAKLQPQQLRPVGEVVVLEGHRAFSCCKIVMLEQHQPQPLRASARSHARGGRSGSAQSRQPAAAEAPDTHTRCVSWGWVSRGGMIMAVVQARVLAGDSPRWWDATALIRRAQALRVRP